MKVLRCFVIANDVRRFPVMVRIIEIMDSVLNLLRRGEAAVQEADRLFDLWCELHVLCVENFDSDLTKVKFHLGHHLSPQLKSFQTSVSCFSNERRNQILKSHCGRLHHIADHHRHATARWLAELLRAYKEGSICDRVRPLTKAASCESDAVFRSLAVLWGTAPISTKACRAIAWHQNPLRAGALLKVPDLFDDGFLSVDFFLKAEYPFSTTRWAAVGVEVARKGPRANDFIKVTAGRLRAACLTSVQCSVPYFVNAAGGIVPVPH